MKSYTLGHLNVKEMPMGMTRRLLLLLAMAVLVCPGCVFFQKEYVAGVDPEAKSFVFADDMRGKTLLLRGGKSVEIDSLAVEEMSEYQRARLVRFLKTVAPYPNPASRAKAYEGLLVRTSTQPNEVIASLPYEDPRSFCGLRAINLFPIRVEVAPTHIDVVELALREGLVKLDSQAIADATRRAKYVKAQEIAKAWGIGVWASPGEQLLEAIDAGDIVEVERLLNLGAPVDYVGKGYATDLTVVGLRLARQFWMRTYRQEWRTPLMVAVKGWRPDMVTILLRHGADVNQVVRDSKRPSASAVRVLHWAARGDCRDPSKRLPMLKMLVEAGANVAAADADSRLIEFSIYGESQWDVIEYLHSKGASVDAFDRKKHGPHFLARAVTEMKRLDVERLIGLGADVNGLDELGNYPLCMAAEIGYVEIVRMLLDAGADPNRKDKRGRTPLGCARSRSNNEPMIKLLIQRGAK